MWEWRYGPFLPVHLSAASGRTRSLPALSPLMSEPPRSPTVFFDHRRVDRKRDMRLYQSRVLEAQRRCSGLQFRAYALCLRSAGMGQSSIRVGQNVGQTCVHTCDSMSACVRRLPRQMLQYRALSVRD